jgi:hypothetical protein
VTVNDPSTRLKFYVVVNIFFCRTFNDDATLAQFREWKVFWCMSGGPADLACINKNCWNDTAVKIFSVNCDNQVQSAVEPPLIAVGVLTRHCPAKDTRNNLVHQHHLWTSDPVFCNGQLHWNEMPYCMAWSHKVTDNLFAYALKIAYEWVQILPWVFW